MDWMRKAMDYITKLNPCITFVPANSSSPNFVTIHSGPTCSSEVGMKGGEQLLYMNAGCFERGLIVPVHESSACTSIIGHWCWQDLDLFISLSGVPQKRLGKIQKSGKPPVIMILWLKVSSEVFKNLSEFIEVSEF